MSINTEERDSLPEYPSIEQHKAVLKKHSQNRKEADETIKLLLDKAKDNGSQLDLKLLESKGSSHLPISEAESEDQIDPNTLIYNSNNGYL